MSVRIVLRVFKRLQARVFREFDTRLTNSLEGAKWLAIVLMACSHAGMALGGEWLWPAFWIGRVCAPIFCFLIVVRLAEKPLERAPRYLKRLLAWGVVAQIPYSAWTWHYGLHVNVLPTLAFGVGLIWVWEKGLMPVAVALGAAFSLAAGYLDLGLIAPPVLLAGYVLYRWSPTGAALMISLSYAGALTYARPSESIAPIICMMVIPVIALCSVFSARLARLPGWAFYAFYPAHIGLIYLYFGPLPALES
jgi:hypothetical protein